MHTDDIKATKYKYYVTFRGTPIGVFWPITIFKKPDLPILILFMTDTVRCYKVSLTAYTFNLILLKNIEQYL